MVLNLLFRSLKKRKTLNYCVMYKQKIYQDLRRIIHRLKKTRLDIEILFNV